jgi:hypothetical protein
LNGFVSTVTLSLGSPLRVVSQRQRCNASVTLRSRAATSAEGCSFIGIGSFMAVGLQRVSGNNSGVQVD